MTDPEAATGIGDPPASASDGSPAAAEHGPSPRTLDWRDRIEVEAVGEDAWRICDKRVPPDDARHVIAFAERTDEGVEVTWLTEVHGRALHPHIDEAARAAHLVLLRIAAERRRPIPIYHLPPATSRRARRRARPAVGATFEEDADGPEPRPPIPPA